MDDNITLSREAYKKIKGFDRVQMQNFIAEKYLATGQFELVLADGENYDGRRPCRYEWIKSLHEQCETANVRFDFIGTGNVFIKDGKVYRIPKAYQRVQAKRSGLSYPSGEINIPMQPRCRTCKRKNSCNGCKWCGKCS